MEISLNAKVECTDGVCGRSVYVLINPVIDQVTHFVVKEDSSPNTEYIVPVDFVAETITHLVMREGHLWGKKDVIIPLSAIGDTRDDTVFLKLDRHQIESLPVFTVKRRWS